MYAILIKIKNDYIDVLLRTDFLTHNIVLRIDLCIDYYRYLCWLNYLRKPRLENTFFQFFVRRQITEFWISKR